MSCADTHDDKLSTGNAARKYAVIPRFSFSILHRNERMFD